MMFVHRRRSVLDENGNTIRVRARFIFVYDFTKLLLYFCAYASVCSSGSGATESSLSSSIYGHKFLIQTKYINRKVPRPLFFAISFFSLAHQIRHILPKINKI